ncbi:DNA methyltransferase [Cupriavidus pinatubonensis]|uniref:DNA methyltransferase n=1 Tax=Cupriavidus pinatubonensis TaxID=248026 RepID=UPI00361B3689
MLSALQINSPKRKKLRDSEWAKFFPYYAGFPEDFSTKILESSGLPLSATILDPWNGSGTTTFSAAQLGYKTYGIDLNPVMVLVARARSLSSTEADSIVPQARSLAKDVARVALKINDTDPLLQWFDASTANCIRTIETRIRSRLVGSDNSDRNTQFERISFFASTFYVALFTVCRRLTSAYRSSNPTWLKTPKPGEPKITASPKEISTAFVQQAKCMADGLQTSDLLIDQSRINISVGDTTTLKKRAFADLILTSPPYCTRIDYTAATRVELALISALLTEDRDALSQRMIGSIKVPTTVSEPSDLWGESALKFLDRLKSHDSKASKTYYYKTHVDYFDKMSKSMKNLQYSLKDKGSAVLVVQDSYYKDLHNDVPTILTEMAENHGLKLARREDFTQNNSLLGINSRSLKYRETSRAIESVICFENDSHKKKP